MESTRFSGKDLGLVGICLLIIVSCTWFGANYFRTAFPEASIQFDYSKKEASKIAADFLDSADLTPPEEYTYASLFGYDGSAKTYLEKELGLEKASEYFGNPVEIWNWKYRWFKAQTKEEFKVRVTPEGRIVYMQHLLDEDAEGAELTEDSARVIADSLIFNFMKQDSSKIEFYESSETGRPNRSDWRFTYQLKDFEPLEGAHYRYSITVTGDRFGGYSEYLHVPDTWFQSYQRMRSFNQLANTFAGVGLFITMIGIVAIFFIRSRRKDLRLKTAMWFGIVASVLLFLNQLNTLPNSIYYYDTTTSWSGFLIKQLALGLLQSLGLGVLIFLLTASAETMYRTVFSEKMSMTKIFSLHGLRTKRVFFQILLGITMTPFFFAYQIVFYMISNHYGGWSPADVPYDNLLSTALPWVAVLFIGFLPAVSEEFISRAFSISFLKNAFKNRFTWLAVLIPAVIWGFGHASYPSQPWWIRGAEVGLAGILVGVIMLRFGILTTLVWHYTVDAFYTAMLLFRSDNTYFVLTASIATGVLVLPLLIALVAYFVKKGFLPEKGLLNSDEKKAVEITETSEAEMVEVAKVPGFQPLPVSLRIAAIGLFAVGLGVTLIPQEKLGKFMKYTVPRKQAIEAFKDTLRTAGWADPDTLEILVTTRTDGTFNSTNSLTYLLKETNSVQRVNAIADSVMGYGTWRLSAWQPENRLRYQGIIHARTGDINWLGPRLPEEMESDSLSKDSAQAIVESIMQARGIDLSEFKLESHYENKRPKRVDHTLIYEANEGSPKNIGEALYRYSANVYGNYLSVPVHPFYKVPEKWIRDRNATTAIRSVRQVLQILLTAGFFGWAIVVLVLRTRSGKANWKKAFLLAIVPGLFAILHWPLMWHGIKSQYINQIAQPWSVYQASGYIGMGLNLVIVFIITAMGLALLSAIHGNKQRKLSAAYLRQSTFDSIDDMVNVSLATIGALMLYSAFGTFLVNLAPRFHFVSSWGIPDFLPLTFPFGPMVYNLVFKFILYTVVLGFISHLWNGPMKKPWLRALLLLATVIVLNDSQAKEPVEWLYDIPRALVAILLIWGIWKILVRQNPYLLMTAVWTALVFTIASSALGTGYPPLMMQTWVFIAVGVIIPFIWLLRRPSKRDVIS